MPDAPDSDNLVIQYRDMPPSPELDAICAVEAHELMVRYPGILGCRVMVARDPDHDDAAYEIAVTLELRNRSVSAYPAIHGHEPAAVAIHRAFQVARRRFVESEDRVAAAGRRDPRRD